MDVVLCFSQLDVQTLLGGVIFLICSLLMRDSVNRYANTVPRIREQAALIRIGARVVALLGVFLVVLSLVPIVVPQQC